MAPALPTQSADPYSQIPPGTSPLLQEAQTTNSGDRSPSVVGPTVVDVERADTAPQKDEDDEQITHALAGR